MEREREYEDELSCFYFCSLQKDDVSNLLTFFVIINSQHLRVVKDTSGMGGGEHVLCDFQDKDNIIKRT